MTTNTLSNSFEGGTNGGNITAGNSGGTSGDAFSTVVWNNASVGTGGNAGITYSSAAAFDGALGCAMQIGPNNRLAWTIGSPAGPRAGISVKFLYSGAPASAQTIAILLGSGNMGYAQIGTGGTIVIGNAASAIVKTGTYVMTSGQKYRLMLAAKKGTGTTDGTLEYRLYDNADTIVDSWSATNVNAGTADPTQARFPGPTAWPTTTYLIDAVSFITSDDPAAWPAIPAGAPPVAACAVRQRVIDARGSTGITLTYALTHLTGPSPTPDNIAAGYWEVEPDSTSESTWRMTVTQLDGQTDSVVVTLPVAGGGTSSRAQMLYCTSPGVFA